MDIPVHLYIVTVCVFLLWAALFAALGYGIYYVVWRPSISERKAKAEMARQMADRRG